MKCFHVIRSFLLIILLTASVIAAKADYRYRSISEIVAKNNYAAIGTIVRLDTNYFWLKVDSMITGEWQRDTIPIMRFYDWSCAVRYAEYQIGQKEIVFFNKSNNVLPEFEYLGYGGGGEFELQLIGDTVVKYSASYGESYALGFDSLLHALKDYYKLRRELKREVLPNDWKQFEKKSRLHKIIGPSKGYDYSNRLVISESVSSSYNKYLFAGCNNRVEITVPKVKIKNVFIEADDAMGYRLGDEFYVKPNVGITSTWVKILAVTDKRDTISFVDRFDVFQLPDPKVSIGERGQGDTVSASYLYSRYGASPLLSLPYQSAYHNDSMRYIVLRFDVDRSNVNGNETVHCKNATGNYDFEIFVGKIKPGDRLRYYNIVAQYPDGRVKRVADKEIYVGERW